MLDRLFARLSRKVHEVKERLHATATMINDFFMVGFFFVFINAKIQKISDLEGVFIVLLCFFVFG